MAALAPARPGLVGRDAEHGRLDRVRRLGSGGVRTSATTRLRDAQRANAGTFVGAICFLVGAALLIPDQADAPAEKPAA